MPNDPRQAALTARGRRRRFDRLADRFDAHDVVHVRVRDGLLDRLEPMQVSPSVIVDLGAATGFLGAELARRYPRASVVAADLSGAMLRRCRQHRRGLLRRPLLRPVQCDAAALPFSDGSVDFVASSLLLPFLRSLPPILAEVRRVLRPGGLFLFASLGPDSFAALRAAGSGAPANAFVDMHDLGDALLGVGLRDPVLDVDRLELSYRDWPTLAADLRAVGAAGGAGSGLGGRGRQQALQAQLFGANGDPAAVGLELVYGHCWGGAAAGAPGEARIGVAEIGRRTR